MSKGRKTCPECGTVNGVRTYYCKECEYAFPMKKRPKTVKREVKDWRLLESGEYIRVVGRSGTYYIKEDGEKMYMSDAGVYIVKSVDSDGIVVVGANKNVAGINHIYMGKKTKSNILDNLIKAPHKIYKVCAPVKR